MRILIITSSYPRTPNDTINAGVFVRDFALALHRLGNEVEIVTHRKRGKTDYREPFCVREFFWLGGEPTLTSLNLKTPWGIVGATSLLLSGMFKLCSRIRAFKPDLVCAMWATPAGFIARRVCTRYGVPYAVWLLGSDVWRYEHSAWGKKMLRKIVEPAKFLFADGIELAKRAEKITERTPNFLPSSRDLSGLVGEIPALKGVNDSYIFVGRFDYNKGPDVFASAIRIYAGHGGTSRFSLFGLGALKNQAESELKDLIERGQVSVKGVIGPEDLVAHLKSARALVIPSRRESIPVIFSDAMQANCPVISTSVGDLDELVRRYKVGIVVPSEDPEALASAFDEMDRVGRVGFEGGCKEAAEQFSPIGSARKFLGIIVS